MRVTLLTCILLGLLVITCAQDETDRRARLRSLISAARGGDLEARKALQSLRAQIKNRRAQSGAATPARRRPASRTRVEPEPAAPASTPAPEIAPEPIVEQEPVFEPVSRPVPVRRIQPEQPVRSRPTFVEEDHLSHQVLHRGLEVDDRSEMNANIRVTNRTRTPPVETIRRYSYFDEQGNYIFGYEAADGSFKEEKRGQDCIVHGKYGYVDPNGVKREFTYTSGNRCDPNAAPDQESNVPLNDQFLLQTEEKKLDDATLAQLQFNRRRQPVQQQQTRNRVQSGRRPVQQVRVQPEQITTQIREQQTFQPKPATTRAPPPPPPTTVRPTTARPVVTTKAPVIFRPTQAPFTRAPARRPVVNDFNFNFDQEFENIFQNFGNLPRNPPPAPVARPVPSLFSQPALPVGKPKVVSHFSQPPLPGVSRPKPKQAPLPVPAPAPKPKPAAPKPAPQPAAPKNSPHQLVFNAATGTFSTVPLTVSNNAPAPRPSSVPSLFSQPALPGVKPKTKSPVPPPPPPPPRPAPTAAPRQAVATGRPLSLSPLPSVPLGSLSFNNPNTAREFDHFFNQFKLN